jgi:hypothetical protein
MSNLDSQFEEFMKEVSIPVNMLNIIVISCKRRLGFRTNNYDCVT